MILIGQYDSPFVRRVGIALKLYGMAFEHRPLSVFGDGPEIARLNPLMRVPTLVLEDGFVLTDSHMILDYLDHRVNKRLVMFPRHEPARHRALKVATLGTGLAEKAVSLFYERRLHEVTSPVWEARCAAQLGQVLAALEEDCPEEWWFGALGHADIAVACALRFVTEAHGLSLPPRLAAFSARAEALPVFAEISQPFLPPS
ncbi:glutathione S-transferase family protein [Stagnihabitans tardus]|uniref:Glutathione S-transferase family protein n=1 Tax=Stagnihabitans tardus TaxID=2699202 RepID=A0AAE4YCK1_9RHOB|nr:glutathione S-transferase family protein [Stagnihabitans tardus]NBZ88718.1 glutathione S-transferase family protein [Stagnihabitans tardus]